MIYGILLAAGMSSRMGRPKQLLEWQGQPLVRHIVQQALGSRLDGLVVVVGAAAAEVCTALAGLTTEARLAVVENPDYAEGMGGSLAIGISALPTEAEAALVLLVDQPLVTSALIDAILAAFRTADGARPIALIPRYQGRRGNPAALSRALFAELRGLRGDEGARNLVQRYASQIRWIDLDDPAVVIDVDTLDEYARLRDSS